MSTKWIAVTFATLLFSTVLLGQEFRGTISGTITDSGGANAPGVKVVATQVNTGSTSQTVTNSDGQYSLPFLAPGAYTITAELTGFKRYSRENLQLGSGDHAVIDIRLEVGDVSTTLNVTAEAPVLNSENASVGQSITTKEVENLPLNGRTPLVLASLAMGVLATGQPSLIHPFDAAGAAGWSIGGAPAQVNEILIDGSPDATWDGRLAYSPPTDAVQEVVVKAFDTDSAFGHTAGGTINQILKSGTNRITGSLWEFNQPNNLLANNFFTNRDNLRIPVLHYNQYGLTAGGPIWIPKVFDGRNKMFWFFAWEGLKDTQPISPNPTYISVPTAAMRNGDLSELLALSAKTVIYNPFTATQSGTTITRTPFGNNMIPQSLLSPIAQAYLKLLPLPNQPGPFSAQNFASTAPTPDNYNNFLGRFDYNATSRDRLFFDIRTTDYAQSKNDYFGNGSTSSFLTRANIGASLDNVFTVNATNLVDVRVNFTRLNEAHPSPTAGFDATSLGFPAYLGALSPYKQLPSISFASTTGVSTLGQTAANLLPSQSVQLYSTWASTRGNHSLKFGADLRQYVANFTNFNNSSGNFSFSSNSWVKASSSASSTVALGQDLAEFLLGLPTSGSYDLNVASSFYEHYVGFFAQDDWRVKSNLTINLGLRFDRDFPYHEKFGQVVNNFDTTAVSPISAAATAAYAKNPQPQLPVTQFNVLGGLTYPSDGAYYKQTSHLFSPRVGFAWSPGLLKGKTVIRGGWAMFVQPVGISQLTITGAYSTNPILNQYGFSQTTTMTTTNNNFLTPAATLANPFPTGLKAPAGSSAGLLTNIGSNTTFLSPEMKDPYSIRWNIGFQHELAPSLVLEAVYMGTHGVHIPIYVTQLNSIPRQYLSTSPVRDNTAITTLNATVPNPFTGLLPNSANLNGATISLAQLLSRFPEFPTGTGSFGNGVIAQNSPAGSSHYNSLNVRLSKRYSNGLLMTFNYIHSRLYEQTTYLNDTDTAPELRPSPYDHPNRYVLGVVYDLPFGRGRRFMNSAPRWVDLVAGGWNINTIYTYQTGAPITWVNGSTTSPGDYLYFGDPINLNNREAEKTATGASIPAFNTTAFLPPQAYADANAVGATCHNTPTLANCAFQYHIRTFPTTFQNLRQDGINEWSPSLTKRFVIKERMAFQLRGEFYNVLNHPTFAAPNTTATNSSFGLITAQANRPRAIQIGARFSF